MTEPHKNGIIYSMDKGKTFTQHRIGKWFITGGLMLLAFVCAAFPWSSASADEQDTVKVGYYENEVFQEGAAEDAVKN